MFFYPAYPSGDFDRKNQQTWVKHVLPQILEKVSDRAGSRGVTKVSSSYGYMLATTSENDEEAYLEIPTPDDPLAFNELMRTVRFNDLYSAGWRVDEIQSTLIRLKKSVSGVDCCSTCLTDARACAVKCLVCTSGHWCCSGCSDNVVSTGKCPICRKALVYRNPESLYSHELIELRL